MRGPRQRLSREYRPAVRTVPNAFVLPQISWSIWESGWLPIFKIASRDAPKILKHGLHLSVNLFVLAARQKGKSGDLINKPEERGEMIRVHPYIVSGHGGFTPR